MPDLRLLRYFRFCRRQPRAAVREIECEIPIDQESRPDVAIHDQGFVDPGVAGHRDPAGEHKLRGLWFFDSCFQVQHGGDMFGDNVRAAIP